VEPGAAPEPVHADPGAHLDRSNTVRAGVFGVQDGIVSNFGLIMGVAGAQISPEAVLVAGTAGIVSGAMSMGAGEYVSVRTQREMLAAGRVVDEEANVDPYRAAAANGSLFAAGGVVPLLPFLITQGTVAVAVSVVLSVLALFTAGAVLTRVTHRSPWRSGLRLLVIGGGAGTLGFLVGSALGVAVG
jgi:vacuolar iron transporter family protein